MFNKKIILAATLVGSISSSYAADLNNQFYEVMDEADANPISLNIKEDDKKFITLYTKLNQKLASINQQKNSKVYVQYKSKIEQNCSKLKVNGAESSSSAYCKYVLNYSVFNML